MTSLRVGFLGLGRMACGWDTPEGATVQTHLKGCLSDPRLRPAILSDVREDHAARVCRDWKLDAETVPPGEFFRHPVDIACVATPDDTHQTVIEEAVAAEAPPRLLLMEKPLGTDPDALAALVKELNSRGCVVAVNYPRRWMPGLSDALSAAASGALGLPLSTSVHYTGGFRHNAAHALDLVASVLGTTCAGAQPIADAVIDHGPSDPTLSVLAWLGPNRVPVTIRGVDRRRLTIFDVDLLFERGRVRVWDERGVRFAVYEPCEVGVPGYPPELACTQIFHDSDAAFMALVWRDLADSVTSGRPPRCQAIDGINAIRLQNALLENLTRCH